MSNQLKTNNLPPLYKIDLSLPPHIRYAQLCADYKSELASLSSLYTEAVECLGASWLAKLLFTLGKKLFLRKLYSKEETEEIRAIAKAVGIEMYLAVAYNTFLDLFSGCTSAGIKLRGDTSGEDRIVHLRTLDWDMEPLRNLIVRIEYIRERKVVARAVTYAGYIGVLTGVREGLSISFNYRANLISSSPIFKHRIHQLLMILGFRRSVPSQLRNILLSPAPPKTIRDLEQWASCSKTRLSSCYLIFCSPSSVLVVERDLAKTTALISTDFLACTNHDVDMEDITPEERILLLQRHGFVGNTVEHIIAESVERKECIVQMQRQTKRRVTLSKVKKWLEQVPVVNEATHYSCIMDPSAEGGGLLWVQQYPSSE